jgi:Family of unknown function (DUF6492)
MIPAIMFVLYCKSYRNDVLRAKRLLASVQAFNVEAIPFYISTPEADRALFESTLGTSGYQWVSDESICIANPRASLADLLQTPGKISQQVIKSEFWRLGLCTSYLCLDSDAEFIRPFMRSNFLHSDGHPYSLVHDHHELLSAARRKKKWHVIKHFLAESKAMKAEFGREGIDWDFGPSPLLWSAKVWKSLDESHLLPKNETLWDAIGRIPTEIRWYGEALLRYTAIPIHPITPLFMVYHYHWQFKENPDTPDYRLLLKERYLGIICQSNWEHDLNPNFAQKPLLSLLWARLRRQFRDE